MQVLRCPQVLQSDEMSSTGPPSQILYRLRYRWLILSETVLQSSTGAENVLKSSSLMRRPLPVLRLNSLQTTMQVLRCPQVLQSDETSSTGPPSQILYRLRCRC